MVEPEKNLTRRKAKPKRTSSPNTIAEKVLYAPIMRTIEKMFSVNGECFIEITADGLNDQVKKILPEKSMYMLLQEKKRPDLMGIAKGFVGLTKRQFVVEVKTGILTFDDIYQLKLYAEMLNSDEAFLISPEGMNHERIVFLRDNPSMLSYSAGNRRITVLQFNIANEELNFIQELKQPSPFELHL